MILAGDIGGTKTVLALFEQTEAGLQPVRDATFKSQEHPSLEDILARFLRGGPKAVPRVACFGVAGAVINGKCDTTNLPWHLDETVLAAAVGAPRGKLLNDLEAAAYGMLYLRPDELCVLNPDAPPAGPGNVAVIAAGTGLGEAMLYWDGERHHPMASEGGHADFAPRTDQEIELLRYLRAKRGGHVSYERVLSGPGFSDLYTFLRDSGYAPETPALREKLKSGEPNVVITQLGMAGEDRLCAATVELFCTIYGAEAGNLALKCMAVGGVFVGGGVAPKILPALQSGSFLRGFTDKGRFADLLNRIQVRVALNPRAPLLGAAHFALRLVS
jgi:glucokinase